MKNNIFCIIICVITFVGCKKDKPLPITEEPTIELLSVNKTNIQEFTDSLVFTIAYRDGDGDLGIANPDSTVIEIRDNRDPTGLVFGYHLSPRSPDGSTLIVQGEVQVVLKNVIVLSSTASSETTTFSIRMKDRAQHWSNTAESETVTIVR